MTRTHHATPAHALRIWLRRQTIVGMRGLLAVLVTVALTAACAPDTTCPSTVRFSTDPIGLATSLQTLPPEPTAMSFVTRTGDVLTFALGAQTFDVLARHAEWAPLSGGQQVLVWSEALEATTPAASGFPMSFLVTDPTTGSLLFGILVSNGPAREPDGARSFGDLTIDYEIACTAPPIDCASMSARDPLPPVDGERLVVRTTTSAAFIERGETRELDGYRIYLETAARPATAVFTSATCDISSGRGPRRGVVIARIE